MMSTGAAQSARLQKAALLGSLLAFAFLFHWSALSGWWQGDDTQVLVHAVRETPASVLFSPESYETLSTSSFTPLVTISFDTDLALFGLDPRWFYAHQLLVLALTAILLTILLARFIPFGLAMLAGVAFIGSPLTTLVARSLMLRHYAEGALLATLSLVLFDLALTSPRKRQRLLMMALSVAAYLLACLAKEFYIPLPALMVALALLRKISLVRTGAYLLPFAAVVAGVIGWRTAILGAVGGYSGEIQPGRVLQLIAIAMTGGAGVTAVAIGLCGLALLAVASVRSPKAAALIAFTTIAFLAPPLAGVGGAVEGRYGFVASTLLVALVVLAARSWPWQRAAVAVVAVFVLAVCSAGWLEARRLERMALPAVSEGKYVYSSRAGDPVLLGRAVPWYLSGLEWLRLNYERRPAGARFLFSMIPLATGEVDAGKVVKVVADGRRLPLDAWELAKVRQLARRYDPSLPITLELSRTEDEVFWKLAPADGSTFTFLSVPQAATFPMGASGSLRVPQPYERQFFRIRREVGGGAWNVSPVLPVPSAGQRVTWSSAAKDAAAR
jgi:hypothetical protein